MFTDNDELASLVAGMVEAQRLILLTSTDGIYDRPPEEEGALLIPHISIEESTVDIRLDGKTQTGRGGMLSKLSSCKKAASLGVITHIANARVEGVLTRLVKNQESLGTTITGSCHVKGVKRWLSYSPTPPCSIIVDDDLKQRLLNNTLISSILPIGVLTVVGHFQKDDIIAIKDRYYQVLGLGLSEYSSDHLKNYLGTYNQKPIIRYEKMFIKG
jgi:glutamate 5-kinase